MQIFRIFARARCVYQSSRPSFSQGRPFFSARHLDLPTAGFQSYWRMIKAELPEPCISRHFSSTACSPLRSLKRVQPKLFETGGLSGRTLALRLIVGLAIGNTCLSSKGLSDIAQCESDEQSQRDVTEGISWEYRRSQCRRVVKKLWVPSLFVLTISLGWQYPLSLLVNLVFLMWSTKPSPSSIYLWVEEKRQEDALKRRGLDRMKAQAAAVMHVEVRDNMLFCLARVTSLTQRSTLVGFLGDWWVVYSSSSAIHTGVSLRFDLHCQPIYERGVQY